MVTSFLLNYNRAYTVDDDIIIIPFTYYWEQGCTVWLLDWQSGKQVSKDKEANQKSSPSKANVMLQ